VIDGILGFFSTAALIFIIMEISLVLEEVFTMRFELRKGFTGTKTSATKILGRHALKVLRAEGTPKQHFATACKYLVIFLGAGLLPGWSGEPALVPPHALWAFFGLVLAGPVFQLVIGWAAGKGAGWPVVLTTAERTVGSATVIFVLAITLVAMTGSDTFVDFVEYQSRHGWLVFHYPLGLLLAFAFAVVSLFTAFHTVFSRTGDDKPVGWRFDDLMPHMGRTVWSLFIIDLFFGGATGPAGGFFLVIKAVIINVGAGALSRLFFQLREDQAEAFILWRLTPISIVILALSLLFPGGFM
jgi:hypothetical protein